MDSAWFAMMPVIFATVALLTMFCIYHIKEKQRQINQKIQKINKLYECPECRKYHRRYQELAKEISDETYKKIQTGRYEYKDGQINELKLEKRLMNGLSTNNVCVHCYCNTSNEVKEEYEWTKFHSDCIALDYKGYKAYENSKEEIDRLTYEKRSMNKYIEKNNLVKECI